MSILFVFTLISLLIAGMQLTWLIDTEVNMKKKTEEERKRSRKDRKAHSSS